MRSPVPYRIPASQGTARLRNQLEMAQEEWLRYSIYSTRAVGLTPFGAMKSAVIWLKSRVVVSSPRSVLAGTLFGV